jgi:hypothetical protein
MGAYGVDGNLLWGTLTATGTFDGDLSGTISCTATYDPAAQQWRGTSALGSGELTIEGQSHPVDFYGSVVPVTMDVESYESPTTCSFQGTGYAKAWTTDGSNMFACISATGSGTGTMTWVQNGLQVDFQIADIAASGTWQGTVSCFDGAPEAPEVNPGEGTVTLTGPEGTVAHVNYTTTGTGTILLGKYVANPGGPAPRPALGKFIEINSNISSAQLEPVWFCVNYDDDEVAALGIDEENLRLFRWNGSSWVQVPSGVNTEVNAVCASLTSFSTYAPMEMEGADSGNGTCACFIATAACGPNDKSVYALRDFRDSYMQTDSVGRGFVSTYYELSLPVAEFIDDYPALKPVARAALIPGVAAGTIAVASSTATKAAIGAILLAASLAAVGWAVRRRSQTDVKS